ncbi:hypothetical protein ACFFRR_005481 [Megaselia abdita]
MHGFHDVIIIAGPSYNYKRISIGTKIFSPNLDQYQELLTKLNISQYKYHTHRVNDHSSFKLLLLGLPQVPPETIKNELKAKCGIDVNSIKEICTNRTTAYDTLFSMQSRNNLNVRFWNARGIKTTSNKIQLKQFLHNNNVDVFMLSETHENFKITSY